MTKKIMRRKANLMNTIVGLEETDIVSDEVLEFDELDEQMPEELEIEDLDFSDEEDSFEVADEDPFIDSDDDEEVDFEEVDTDADGFITIEEFIALDVDGDGKVSLSEIKSRFSDETEVDLEEEFELPEDGDDDDILSDEEIDETISSLEEDAVVASEEEPGIEDAITDTAKGGEPTVIQVAPGGEEARGEVSSDAEVFPTESDRLSDVIARLDRLANYCEKHGNKKLAYRIDVIADKLENK